MKSNKFVRGIFGLILSCFVIVGITSCAQPGGGYTPQSNYLAAVDGVPDEFLGTWEATNWAGDIYVIEKNKITATYMEMNVVSASTVVTSEGYTLIFCQVPQGKGTEYTPEGNFYAAAVKANGTNIDFCFQLDYLSVYTTLEDLQKVYTASYSKGSNYFPTYKKNAPAGSGSSKQPVVVTDSNSYMTQVKFEENKVTLFMMGNAVFDEYTSFTPKRDKTKENSNVLLYLYSESDRTYAGDFHYMKINKDGSIYWYEYDDEDNDTTIDFCNDEGYMPIASSDDLTKILALYE